MQLPNGSLNGYPIQIGAKQLQTQVDELRLLLEKRATDEYLPLAQKIAEKLTALVFVNDGVLRKIPMAALHDGKQFLIQKYAIAITPSLNLTVREPINRSRLQALILGLTVERPPFAALLNVDEATGVQKILRGTKLLDRNFTIDRLQAQLQKHSYPIVHIAICN